MLLAAERSDLVLLTCSSIGPCAEVAAEMVSVPVLRIDEPMAEEAVAIGKRIAVIATLGSTLKPAADLVERHAERAGRRVAIERVLCEGAFEAASAGNPEEHDRIVLEGLESLVGPPQPANVVVLAQASKARVAERLPPDNPIPILSSPRSGIRRAGEVLRVVAGQERS